MNKAELVSAVAEQTGVTKKTADAMVKALTETITEELKKGEKVQIIGFGTFESRARKERTGRNPQKPGVEVVIPASKAPVFKAGKAFKDALNQ